MAAITLKGISAAALQGTGLDLKIADREFVILAGPDRSSLVGVARAIAGLDAVGGGEIFFDDRRINDLPPSDRAVGYVAHDFVPYPRLSVREHILLGLEIRKFGKAEAEKRIQEVAELLGLETCLNTRPDDLSAEQCQRLALARAMVQQPKVYVLAEPFAGLSPEAQRRGRAEITKLRERSAATIVYATTNGAEALALGGRIVFLAGGVIRQDADARTLFESPATVAVAAFLGDPPMNLVDGTIKTDRDGIIFSETGDGTIALRIPAERIGDPSSIIGKPVILGVRPHDLAIAGPSVPKGEAFRALVDRVELNTYKSDVYIRTGAHDLICSSRIWDESKDGGRRAEFTIAPEKVHLFDAVTGYRITAQT